MGDGFYAKREVLLADAGRHLLTRLRCDADLYHLWRGGRQPGQRGPTRKYDGKACFDDLSRWESAGVHPVHTHVSLYTQVLHSKHFARRLRVVLLLEEDPTLHNLMNALVRRMTARRIWKVIYSQLGLEGSVDINHFESLECQFWHRRAA